MKLLTLASLALVLLAWPTHAQAPAKLTARDIHVHPFAQEHKETKFKSNSNDLPHELTVTTTDKIRFYGKRRTKGAPSVLGKPTGHLGQLVLLPTGNRKGTISLKKAFGTIRFFAVLELPDDALDSKDIPLKEGKNYAWSAQTEGDQTTLRILADDGSEVASSKGPANKVRGLGFAVTARTEGNEVDLTITYN
jgi:hypothetical protein